MHSYSETNVFTPEHLALFKEVQALVASFPDTDAEGRLLRCHEVARAVAIAWNLTVIDGVYGCVEHSWCLIPRACGGPIKAVAGDPLKEDAASYLKSRAALGTHFPVIIDPYAVGRLPQAQMVSVGSTLPHDRWYSERDLRTDIRVAALQLLCGTKYSENERLGHWVGDSFLNKDGIKIV